MSVVYEGHKEEGHSIEERWKYNDRIWEFINSAVIIWDILIDKGTFLFLWCRVFYRSSTTDSTYKNNIYRIKGLGDVRRVILTNGARFSNKRINDRTHKRRETLTTGQTPILSLDCLVEEQYPKSELYLLLSHVNFFFFSLSFSVSRVDE